MAYTYALGAVKPWVKSVADDVGNRFGVTTIYGVGAREIANSDHPKGLALDFMVGSDQSKGDQIAAYLQQNASSFNVTYIIWKQHIWNISRASEGWRAMPDRGGITENHYDHVHVSFKSQGISPINIISPITLVPGVASKVADPVASIKQSVEALTNLIKFVSDSHNWARVGLFVFGLLLLVMAASMLGITRKVNANVRSIRASSA